MDNDLYELDPAKRGAPSPSLLSLHYLIHADHLIASKNVGPILNCIVLVSIFPLASNLLTNAFSLNAAGFMPYKIININIIISFQKLLIILLFLTTIYFILHYCILFL